MAAHLPGVIASCTALPVIGFPVKASLEGLNCSAFDDSNASGNPCSCCGIDASRNAAILAAQIIALSDPEVAHRLAAFKEGLKEKVIKADDELKNKTPL